MGFKGSSILDFIPMEQNVHKENTMKPGSWNNGKKKNPILTSAVKINFKGKEVKNMYKTV